jgi:putative spermidine/putrescine transport system ATP-binding protein
MGTPEELYERPASPVVAGFVGISNLLTGATAEALLGTDGTFSVRPEKITLTAKADATAPADGEVAAAGRVVEVIYAGPATRFVVDLDAGARLVAVAQNLQTTSSDVQRMRDTEVVLRWQRAHVVSVPTA